MHISHYIFIAVIICLIEKITIKWTQLIKHDSSMATISRKNYTLPPGAIKNYTLLRYRSICSSQSRVPGTWHALDKTHWSKATNNHRASVDGMVAFLRHNDAY